MRILKSFVALILVAVAGLVSGGLGTTASAEPVQTADRLLVNYRKLSADAEKSAEAMHKAQVEFDKQRSALFTARTASAQAQRTLNTSQKTLTTLQSRVNKVVRASYRGAKINRLYAVLVSDSPQNLLDQMSGLELVSRQSAADLRSLKATRKKTLAAKRTADDSAAAATTALAAVEKTRSQLQVQRADLNLQAVRIRAIYETMTGKQLAELRGPKFNFDPRLVPKGTSAALVAVQAALTRIGDPYVWGATGPSSFDCSGLMVWAYKQAGQTLPRSSESQQAGGQPVSRDKLLPGDLIIYYSDAHHVGMYVGDGYVIHASTFGVPVKVVPLDKAGPFQSARRYS